MTSSAEGNLERRMQELQQTRDMIPVGYDAVYSGTPKSPTLRRLWHELAEGLDFPVEFGHVSFTTLRELRRMAAALRLGQGRPLGDLGCGMAGPALWMARESGGPPLGGEPRA